MWNEKPVPVRSSIPGCWCTELGLLSVTSKASPGSQPVADPPCKTYASVEIWSPAVQLLPAPTKTTLNTPEWMSLSLTDKLTGVAPTVPLIVRSAPLVGACA